MTKTGHKVFIDTDIGNDIDDAFALCFALLHPELDVVGVSTVESHGHLRAMMVQAFLTLCGAPGVQVSIGCEHSPTHSHIPALPSQLAWAQSAAGDKEVARTFALESREHGRDPAEHLFKVASENPREVTLVALGRLTNVDRAFRRFPELPSLLKGLWIMGGELRYWRREHNFANDYVAADRVLLVDMPRFLATWSVSGELRLSPDDLAILWKAPHPAAELLRSLQGAWGHLPVLYDLAPLLHLIRPDLFTTKRLRLRVETVGLYTRGLLVPCEGFDHGLPIRECSVPDLVEIPGAPTEVTLGMDVAGAKQIFMSTLTSAPRPESQPAPGEDPASTSGIIPADTGANVSGS